jgi:hypothetical protein
MSNADRAFSTRFSQQHRSLSIRHRTNFDNCGRMWSAAKSAAGSGFGGSFVMTGGVPHVLANLTVAAVRPGCLI